MLRHWYLMIAVFLGLLIAFYEIDITIFEDMSIILTFGPRLW